jgi:hypothetical protein
MAPPIEPMASGQVGPKDSSVLTRYRHRVPDRIERRHVALDIPVARVPFQTDHVIIAEADVARLIE